VWAGEEGPHGLIRAMVCLPASDVNKVWTHEDKYKNQAFKDEDKARTTSTGTRI